MSGQRARPAVPTDHRSALPSFPGVPWWGAVLIAMVAAAIGFAFDAGSGGKELTGVFSTLYVIGCMTAVLAVRRSGVFTAVIQPPLVLFVVVPAAYFVMHSADILGIKDVLINCGYPLIERFPLMFFTSAVVLLLGLARWFFGRSAREGASESSDTPTRGGRLSAKVSALRGKAPDAGESEADEPQAAEKEPRRRHTVERRASRTPRPSADGAARGERPTRRTSASSRSRHARPPETEIIEAVVDRPRRRSAPTDSTSGSSGEPRRRPRSSSSREPRADRGERSERRERERPRPERRSRYDDYEPLEPHRPAGNGTHHPFSRVRYRGGEESDDRSEYRTRRRAPRDDDADRWEYDI